MKPNHRAFFVLALSLDRISRPPSSPLITMTTEHLPKRKMPNAECMLRQSSEEKEEQPLSGAGISAGGARTAFLRRAAFLSEKRRWRRPRAPEALPAPSVRGPFPARAQRPLALAAV